MNNKTLFEVKDLKVYFNIKRSFTKDIFEKNKILLKAVDGVSFNIGEGEVLSLVGESGSGKTTIGKAILQLVDITQGEVSFCGEKVNSKDKVFMKKFRQKAQMVFQDPYQSINPRKLILDIVAEPLDVNRLVKSVDERIDRTSKALENVDLRPAEEYLYRYPHELSGGQRQRVVLASSLIMNPSFIVADEPVSMLDASIRTGILRLMMSLRDMYGLSYLFITHDLSLAWLISDRIAIMYLGNIMEIGSSDKIVNNSHHPYTRALLAVMPKPGVIRTSKRDILSGETPSPIEDIKGCKFNARCKYAKEICRQTRPTLTEIESEHSVACHFANEIYS